MRTAAVDDTRVRLAQRALHLERVLGAHVVAALDDRGIVEFEVRHGLRVLVRKRCKRIGGDVSGLRHRSSESAAQPVAFEVGGRKRGLAPVDEDPYAQTLTGRLLELRDDRFARFDRETPPDTDGRLRRTRARFECERHGVARDLQRFVVIHRCHPRLSPRS